MAATKRAIIRIDFDDFLHHIAARHGGIQGGKRLRFGAPTSRGAALPSLVIPGGAKLGLQFCAGSIEPGIHIHRIVSLDSTLATACLELRP
jgi:hypothetical protein